MNTSYPSPPVYSSSFPPTASIFLTKLRRCIFTMPCLRIASLCAAVPYPLCFSNPKIGHRFPYAIWKKGRQTFLLEIVEDVKRRKVYLTLAKVLRCLVRPRRAFLLHVRNVEGSDTSGRYIPLLRFQDILRIEYSRIVTNLKSLD